MPQSTNAMMTTHPKPTSMFNPDALAACIDACMECATTCTSCADACLAEEHVQHLVRCIRLNLDCADICAATGMILTRRTMRDETVLRAQLQACIAACRACGDECDTHASEMSMEHCRVCADACRRCEQACQALLGNMQA